MPNVELVKAVRFESAHRLPNVPEGHKCQRLHGHSYRVEICLRGPIGDTSGWLVDYSDIAAAWKPLHNVLDHYYLNEVEGLENPTSEVLAVWIWDRIIDTLPDLYRITVHETCTSSCSYFGPDAP
jgi:6-pyruvoyltetrahydropterin/6-carboxytetrahydropterin synthase